MRSLLKAELFRLKNEKSLQVVFFIAIGLALLVVSFTQFYIKQISSIYDFTNQIVESFSMSSNVGLILSIVALVVSCREYNYGTIRNKIIAGHSRTSIFYSKLFALLIVCTIILLTYTCSLYLFGLIFSSKIQLPSFKMFLEIVLIGLLNTILSFTFLHTITILMKSVGSSIAVYLGITIVVSLVGTFVFAMLALSSEDVVAIMEWIPSFQLSLLTGESSKFPILLVKSIVSCLGLSAILVLFGNYFFNKKDIK